MPQFGFSLILQSVIFRICIRKCSLNNICGRERAELCWKEKLSCCGQWIAPNVSCGCTWLIRHVMLQVGSGLPGLSISVISLKECPVPEQTEQSGRQLSASETIVKGLPASGQPSLPLKWRRSKWVSPFRGQHTGWCCSGCSVEPWVQDYQISLHLLSEVKTEKDKYMVSLICRI